MQSSRTDGSLRRIAASPVPSDGRLTPRRSQGQYTSYVLITQEKAAKVHAVNEQVPLGSTLIHADYFHMISTIGWLFVASW